MIPNQSDKFLSDLALSLFKGEIFTDRHCQKEDIRFVFPILSFIKEEMFDEIKNVSLIYEYLEEAAPHSVNGMPMFFSARFLNEHDTKVLFEKYEKINNAIKQL